MLINPFRLISFDSSIWGSNKLASDLANNDTKCKAEKTRQIMEFISKQVSGGVAKIDKEPHLYALSVSGNSKEILSIIGAINYDEQRVLFPNESTHPDKLKMYSEMFSKYKLQINPVLTFYKKGPSVKSLLTNVLAKNPKIEANIGGFCYRLWCIDNPVDLINIKENISKIDRLYIADGHHRFSIFQHLSRKVSAKIMISLMDVETIRMKSCPRVIVGDVYPNWLEKIKKHCVIEKIDSNKDDQNIVIYFKNGEKYKVLFKESVLEKLAIYFAVENIIIKESFGITEKEGVVFPLPGSISLPDAPKVFDLYPGSSTIVFVPELNISEFFKIVDNGEKLPPTSTWFEPKIVDGFLMSRFG